MFGLSLGEVLLLGAIALIVIGPNQLPEMARTLGRFLNELKRATDGLTSELKQQTRVDFDLRESPPQPTAPAVAEPERKDDTNA